MFSLRIGVSADAALIARIQRESRIAAMPWLPRLRSPAEDAAFFRESVLASDSVVIADEGDWAVGFVAFRTGWIDHLYVSAQDRGRGVGIMLLHAALAELPRPIRLYTFQRKRQRAVFTKSTVSRRKLLGTALRTRSGNRTCCIGSTGDPSGLALSESV